MVPPWPVDCVSQGYSEPSIKRPAQWRSHGDAVSQCTHLLLVAVHPVRPCVEKTPFCNPLLQALHSVRLLLPSRKVDPLVEVSCEKGCAAEVHCAGLQRMYVALPQAQLGVYLPGSEHAVQALEGGGRTVAAPPPGIVVQREHAIQKGALVVLKHNRGRKEFSLSQQLLSILFLRKSRLPFCAIFGKLGVALSSTFYKKWL